MNAKEGVGHTAMLINKKECQNCNSNKINFILRLLAGLSVFRIFQKKKIKKCKYRPTIFVKFTTNVQNHRRQDYFERSRSKLKTELWLNLRENVDGLAQKSTTVV